MKKIKSKFGLGAALTGSNACNGSNACRGSNACQSVPILG